jgi:hypothetical protein
MTSAASCAADHFYLAADVGSNRPGCSSTSGLYTTCCLKSNFLWGDGGETWLKCANEGGTCDCNGKARYGDAASATWSFPRDASGGTISCSHTVFGDPKYGVAKTCECSHDCSQECVGRNVPINWVSGNKEFTCDCNSPAPPTSISTPPTSISTPAPAVTSGSSSSSSGKHFSSAIFFCVECIASSSRCTSFRQLHTACQACCTIFFAFVLGLASKAKQSSSACL